MMSDVKISDLPASSKPLSGSEILPLVQGGLTKMATVADVRDGLAAASDLTNHKTDTANPHAVTASQVGLGNVDNTSDVNKPVSTAQQAAIDAKVSKTGDTMTGPLSVPALNGGQLAGMRNKIINGKMEIAQRGTSFAAAANGYTLDRWFYGIDGAGVVTVSQQADAPSSNEFQNSLRAAVTTADASIAASDFSYIGQRIEGYNARDLIGRTFTLSFWVRSSKTGTHCVAFRNSNGDRSYVLEYTVSAANTWEQKSVRVSGGLITAGTWAWTTGLGLRAEFALAAGSSYHTTPNAWQTGNFIATANQVNVLDTVDNIFAITGVQLEVGEVATPFEHRNVGTELALCQRYYCETRGHLTSYASAAGQDPRSPVYWPVPMRVAPTTTNAGGSVANASSANLGEITVMGAAFRVVAAAAGLTSVIGSVITASAEL